VRQQPRLLTSPKYIDERERCIMATITKTYKESVPPLRFIGKKYLDSDRVNGTFGAKWGEWFQNGWFGTVEKQFDGNLTDVYENGNAYIGLMRENSDGVFEYWIGILMPAFPKILDLSICPQANSACVGFTAKKVKFTYLKANAKNNWKPLDLMSTQTGVLSVAHARVLQHRMKKETSF